jgi:cytidine deaminase
MASKIIKFETELEVFESVSQLPQNIQNLMNKAREARDKAYAPYSLFKVGAALKLASGKIVTGSNQENAAFPSGLCAERVAVFYAGAEFPDVKIEALALTVKSDKKEVSSPTPPCGACRQSLAEYENKQNSPMAIYFMGETGKVVKAASVKDLLPFVFDNSFLG